MRIAILHPSYEDSSSPFKEMDPACDPSRYLPGSSCTNFHIAKATAARQVREVAQAGFDAIVNLCDGAWEEDRAGIEVVQALERLGAAFTGAGSAFYEPSREAMKMASHAAEVRVPAYVMARCAGDAERALEQLRFPMIVKHPCGYSSLGLTPDSRVTDGAGLGREAARMIDAYGGALVEEFIAGREFTVLVSEPRDGEEEPWALPPVEFTFPDGESFKHFDLKWRRFEEMQTEIVAGEELSERLRQAAARVFAALGGSGYARCDFRLDASGEIYFLEINPNCALFYPEGSFGSADFILARDPAGHRGFLEHLLACAVRRRDRARRTWELRFHRERGFGLFAARTLRAGEVVEPYEERAQVLVSRRHVEQHWRGPRRGWFELYCWPLTAEVHGRWSDNPDDWRPLNHRCDPNTWLEGLNLVARRDIPAGEELTVDYATFCGSDMAPFECHCGAPQCRRVIRGEDHLLPEIRELYTEHVSDYVRAARREGLFEIVQTALGRAVVARRRWVSGEVVSRLWPGERLPKPARWTIQWGDEEHAEPRPFELCFVNHSCDPNIRFDVEAGGVRALRDIAPGDPLTCFYPSTEWVMAEPFDCRCDAALCAGWIDGAARMPRQILDRHVLSGNIRRKLATR